MGSRWRPDPRNDPGAEIESGPRWEKEDCAANHSSPRENYSREFVLFTKSEQKLWWRDLDYGQKHGSADRERRTRHGSKCAAGGINAENLDGRESSDVEMLAEIICGQGEADDRERGA